MENLVLRELHSMQEFNTLLQLQQAIWGMAPGETVAPYVMQSVDHTGGVIIGAELDGQLVGFCFGFVGWREEGRIFWSYMTGVLPEYRGKDIGFRLKHAQRRWALDHGYSVIGWTFDPLQRGNANFNFRRLGGIANTYLVNFYGAMTDAINAGLASDRLEVRWQLNDPRVIASAENRPLDMLAMPVDDATFALRATPDQALIQSPETAFQSPVCYIEIPYQISALKRSAMAYAQAWQLALRSTMQTAFALGYVIVDFVTQDQRGWYVLKRATPHPSE